MAVQGPIGGVAFLKNSGQQYQLRGSLTVSPLTLEAAGVAGQDGVHGYTEKPVVPYIEAELTDSAGLSIADFQTMRNVPITAELSNGKTYVLANAWYAGTAQLETQEGKIKVKFEGLSCQEIQ